MGSVEFPSIHADNEWNSLRSVIVGRAENSCFPSESRHMVEATMPEQYHAEFRPKNRFPADILKKADEELNGLAKTLEKEGITVHRPKSIDWHAVGGYTAAMPRDGLITVGNTIIEAPFAWGCRRNEINLAYGDILADLARDANVRVVRAPKVADPDPIYKGVGKAPSPEYTWAINNSRPAFDAADFMRLGKVLIGQYSHVTNQAGVQHLRDHIPEGYTVEMLEVNDPHAMHIDATILPLREGLMVYNPARTSEAALRKHKVLQGWDIHPYPFTPDVRTDPPLLMTSEWLCMNVLSLSDSKVIVEQSDTGFAAWVKQFGIEPIPLPMQHVQSIGGSFHCATVDLVRER